MDFWSWALKAYARPGAAQTCLQLQDRHGQNVPYLLWAAWAAAEGRPLDPEVLATAADLALRWETAAVGPLRAARRNLKPAMAGVADEAREALRGQVKAMELQAERLLMTALEALTPPAAGPPAPSQPALAAAAGAWPRAAPADLLGTLADTLC